VSDLDGSNECPLYSQNAHECDITAVAYSVELSLVASGDASGLINLWDFEFFKHDGVCLGHTTAVKGLAFLAPYPVLAACGADGGLICMVCDGERASHNNRLVCRSDAGGNIAMWSVRGARKTYELLCRVVNTERLVPPPPAVSVPSSGIEETPATLATTADPTPQGGGESVFLTQRKDEASAKPINNAQVFTEPQLLGARLVPVPVLALSAHVKWSKQCQCMPKEDGDSDDGANDTDDGIESITLNLYDHPLSC
jgi:hypothetical protein